MFQQPFAKTLHPGGVTPAECCQVYVSHCVLSGKEKKEKKEKKEEKMNKKGEKKKRFSQEM